MSLNGQFWEFGCHGNMNGQFWEFRCHGNMKSQESLFRREWGLFLSLQQGQLVGVFYFAPPTWK